ncbi:MAG: hypothetical protein CFE31_09160 [Rhizobiales bacterium PAR1]|nr:MAG: hypothetical protein CFE31_09160 [Rhizobiales bacterium PAR1]
MMHRRAFLTTSLLALAFPAFAQSASPVLDNPLAAVKRVYDPKVKDVQRPYTKKLRALYAAATKKSKQLNEPVSGLDFDPIIAGQDSDDDFRKTLKYAVEPRGAGYAVVVVKFKQFKTEPEVTLFYEVMLDGNEWKIDDIVNPAKEFGWRLSTMLIAGAKGQ